MKESFEQSGMGQRAWTRSLERIVNHLKIQEIAALDAEDAESLGSLRTLLARAMEISHVGRYPLEAAI